MTSTMRFDKWENSLGIPYNSIIQVVSGTYSVVTTTTSGTYSDTGLSASITPKFSNSKILVLANQAGCAKYGTDTTLQLQLVRNGSVVIKMDGAAAYTQTTALNEIGTIATSYLDSPGTTLTLTYKTQMAAFSANGGTVATQYNVGTGSPTSTITLLEIAQ
jgi:hypothetical protein